MFIGIQILIGYNRGLIVLWDMTTNKPEHTYTTSEVLHSFVILLSFLQPMSKCLQCIVVNQGCPRFLRRAGWTVVKVCVVGLTSYTSSMA